MTPYDQVYLSPHPDDAVLSCGGHIWQQTRAGQRVLVVTVFGREVAPDVPLSPFAQALHARWGTGPDATARRREEDLAALSTLDAQPAYWPFPDCIYRRGPDGSPLYANEEALWGAPHPAEEDVIDELAERVAGLPLAAGGSLHGPLAVGHHVDHQILRRAAERSNIPLIYYEDYPYAEDSREVIAAREGIRLRANPVRLSEAALEAKITAIACYRSQISTFWAGLDGMAAAIRAHAERTAGGSGRLAERYWLPTGSQTRPCPGPGRRTAAGRR